ncbi:MAG: quinone-dependent dihydroorotate dehydrogenase [Verrucomicrobiota bacterium]
MLYRSLIRPYLFRKDPEVAHELAIDWMARFSGLSPALSIMRSMYATRQPVTVAGLEFPNRVGLAAGMDKDGRAFPAFAALGFGHVEVGTVTPEGQPGNPKPRMFRFPEEQALINRMGFNNQGAEAMKQRIQEQYPLGKRGAVLGINLGKAKVTPLEEATGDYVAGIRILGELADYLAINISSPNTQGLRDLQGAEYLDGLLGPIRAERDAVAERVGRHIPVFLKIAPDASFDEIEVILTALERHGFDGIIATNTTLDRPGILAEANQAGGLSGAPVTEKSTKVIRFVAEQTQGRLPIIGVGGIMQPTDAAQKLDAGASLVQLYTGFVYGGPGFAKAVSNHLSNRNFQ